MTTTSGGMSAVSNVILYPNNTIVPIDQTTPIATTNIEESTAVNDLKNSVSIMAVSRKESTRKSLISDWTFIAISVRMRGKPE